jgi:glutathione S-transferase
LKLRMNEGSPFARKVRIFAREKGLSDKIEESVVTVSPLSTNDALAHENPLVKIPVLVMDNGEWLYDSAVICEYLDTLHQGVKSFPVSGLGRFMTLRRQALCDGILDAAVLCRYELALRPAALLWDKWIDGQKQKVFGGLFELEAEAESWSDEFEILQMSSVCVLGYLDFRFPGWEWRHAHPRLAHWYSDVLSRPSVLETAPP